MKNVDLAVFDLDNTLYDWYASFLPAFYSMVDAATSILCCDRELLLDQLRSVHVRYHDVEHPYSLLETPIVRQLLGKNAREVLDPAFYAFNKARKDNLKLFPDVRETLDELERRNIKLAAFTDSSYFAALRRIRQLELVTAFRHIFCRARSESIHADQPFVADPEDRLHAITIELPADEAKPDPRVLLDIAKAERIEISSIAYIGDSVARDVLMARKAGCLAIWAKYGVPRDPEMYEQLVRISHWTDEDIKRERNFANEAATIVPDFTCERSIADILPFMRGPMA
ncbi:MAG TPA: HAD family hydrolase [Xanthobacteraceae bacterium]|nr:HAD family hydrolase [Xanthobacteraceae bacterium]